MNLDKVILYSSKAPISFGPSHWIAPFSGIKCRPELRHAFSYRAKRLRISSALGFPSKTSAEIAPDHLKSYEDAFTQTSGDSVQTSINIVLYLC